MGIDLSIQRQKEVLASFYEEMREDPSSLEINQSKKGKVKDKAKSKSLYETPSKPVLGAEPAQPEPHVKDALTIRERPLMLNSWKDAVSK